MSAVETMFKEIKAAGNASFKAGQYNEAIISYTKCIELKRDEPTVYVNRANAYSKIEAPYNTLNDCNKAIELDPKYAKAYYWRAKTLKELCRYNLALEDFKKALSMEPENKSIPPEIKAIEECLATDKRIDVKLYPKPEEFRSTKSKQLFDLNGQYSGSKQYDLS